MSRIIVITGTSSGMGLELRKKYEANGDTVIGIGLGQTGEFDYPVDVSDYESVKHTFADIATRFGRIDMLINNAGIGIMGIVELLSNDAIKKITEVDFYGVVYCSQAALPYMSKGARIVNMSSAMALFPVPYRSMYAAVKMAVFNFSISLRMEVEHIGIDVVAICPGNVASNFNKNRIKEFATNERYGNVVQQAFNNREQGKGKKLITVEYATNKIYAIANKKKTKPFYIIGKFYKFLYFVSRFVPKGLIVKLTNKFSKNF